MLWRETQCFVRNAVLCKKNYACCAVALTGVPCHQERAKSVGEDDGLKTNRRWLMIPSLTLSVPPWFAPLLPSTRANFSRPSSEFGMQLELSFSNDPVNLPSVHAFLGTTLQQSPLAKTVIDGVSQFVEIAVQNAMATAYPEGETGSIRLSVEEQHGKLEIRIRDFGIPSDVKELERNLHQEGANQFGVPLHEIADEVHWLSNGPDGKTLQIIKWLHDKHVADQGEQGDMTLYPKDTPLAPDQEYSIRRMRDDEAEQVSQLMYRTYGNTYFNEDIYYPDRVAAQNRRDIVSSYVAVSEAGEVVGHYALEREGQGPVVEVGQAVVSPAHRRRGLLNRMKDFALEDAAHTDLLGWFADAVTVHTATQKSNIAHGGQLTAVQLAISPKKEHFDSQQEQTQRVTCLMYFHWLKPPQSRTVYVPARHAAVVESIYQRLECPVEFGAVELGTAEAPTGHGTQSVQLIAGAARARVSADSLGEDTVQLIRKARRELVEQTHLEVVFVDLPVQDPGTPFVAEQLEADGFGFLGICPELSERGDVLRLAYLVEPVGRDAIHTIDETAADLVDYVLAEQARVRSKAM